MANRKWYWMFGKLSVSGQNADNYRAYTARTLGLESVCDTPQHFANVIAGWHEDVQQYITSALTAITTAAGTHAELSVDEWAYFHYWAFSASHEACLECADHSRVETYKMYASLRDGGLFEAYRDVRDWWWKPNNRGGKSNILRRPFSIMASAINTAF